MTEPTGSHDCAESDHCRNAMNTELPFTTDFTVAYTERSAGQRTIVSAAATPLSRISGPLVRMDAAATAPPIAQATYALTRISAIPPGRQGRPIV